MHKKIYLNPEFEVIRVKLCDVLLASVENYSEVIDNPGDWGDATAPPPDPDEEITW